MTFDFDLRQPDSPVVAALWRTASEGGGSFISRASSQWEMVLTEQGDERFLSLRGPETAASPAPVPENARFFGIQFKHGSFLPRLPVSRLVNRELRLPVVGGRVWLGERAWILPRFDDAELFAERLLQSGELEQDALVQAALRGEASDVSRRTLQRRFKLTTGLSLTALRQIERARSAAALLEAGHSVADTAFLSGYTDQSHLTRSLRRYTGLTPVQLRAGPKA